jgi:stage II sporulation protein AA (anti-sigma F factor antagonist)
MLKHHCQYETKYDDGILEIRLGGEIDHYSAVSIRVALDAEISRLRPKKTVMDLGQIEFMDSSGLGLIMGRYSLMQKLGGTLTLRSPNERIVKIFELAGLGRLIEIEKDGEEGEK